MIERGITINDLLLPVPKPIKIGQGFDSGTRIRALGTHRRCLNQKLPDGSYMDADDTYAIDFSCAEGSPIFAAKEGIVFGYKDDSTFTYFPDEYNEAILAEKALDENNYVIIGHDDGTIALYAHLQYRGVLVKGRRDRIRQGECIALSGNTGFSSAPHLHFVIYGLFSETSIESIPFSFKDYAGSLYDREIHPELYDGEKR